MNIPISGFIISYFMTGEDGMAVGDYKLKVLYLRDILSDCTDEKHAITLKSILKRMQQKGISAERKSIYDDLDCLREYGMDIRKVQKEGTCFYWVANRQFTLAELKLLVDSVQSSKFITLNKSKELIKKLETLANEEEAGQLQRQVYVTNRPKTINENIYQNVDMLHMAINENSQIYFHYFQWTEKGEMQLRKNGDKYCVSPWLLCCDSDNYYMIAYDGTEKMIKHFRVDKMLDIELIRKRREGAEQFHQAESLIYSNRFFDMYGGEEETVHLVCHNSMAGVIIDRFGKDVTLRKHDEDHFAVNVKVVVSKQFRAWIIALGENVQITGPERVVNQMRMDAERLVRQYGG